MSLASFHGSPVATEAKWSCTAWNGAACNLRLLICEPQSCEPRNNATGTLFQPRAGVKCLVSHASARRYPWPASGSLARIRCGMSDVSFKTVEERQQLFNRIAPAYDNLNDWLSIGQHRIWKRMAVSWSGAKAGDTVLDICCGSGDLAFLLAERVGPMGKVIGLDFAAEQLLVASERQQAKKGGCYKNLEWLQGDALNLPFADETFDAVTVGYGLRNVADIHQALREMCRVIKPGSGVSILDFNRPSTAPMKGIQEWLLDNVVVPVATRYGMREEYAYLKQSIARFPTGTEQEQLAREAGFSYAVHYELVGGLMGTLVLRR